MLQFNYTRAMLFYSFSRTGGNTCSALVQLNTTGNHLAYELDRRQLKNCFVYLTGLQWEPDTARPVLEKLTSLMVMTVICFCHYFLCLCQILGTLELAVICIFI